MQNKPMKYFLPIFLMFSIMPAFTESPGFITADNIPVREQPGIEDSQILFYLDELEEVTVIYSRSRRIDGINHYWNKIRTESGDEGWASSEFVAPEYYRSPDGNFQAYLHRFVENDEHVLLIHRSGRGMERHVIPSQEVYFTRSGSYYGVAVSEGGRGILHFFDSSGTEILSAHYIIHPWIKGERIHFRGVDEDNPQWIPYPVYFEQGALHDDPEGNPTEFNTQFLIGYWGNFPYDQSGEGYTFRADGSFTYFGGESVSEGEWRIEGNQLNLGNWKPTVTEWGYDDEGNRFIRLNTNSPMYWVYGLNE